MPEIAELKEDLTEAAKEASRKISNVLKRQYRLRLTSACRVCNNLNLQYHDETHPIGQLDLRLADIRSAATATDAGCPYCKVVLTCVDQLMPGAKGDFKVMLQYHENGYFELMLGFEERLKFEIFLPPGTHIPSWPQLRNSGTIARHSGHQQCFEFISQKIRDCEAHPQCQRPSSSSSFLPHRVLDVGSLSSTISNSQTIKILENCRVPGQKYIALSYCWGGHLPFKTTLSNISTLTTVGVPFSSLPRVFLDAIIVALKLGIRYLWIDSLCIIQDSKPDWEREASKMAEYYSHAHLVIASSVSPNPTVPFLAPRSTYWLPVPLKFVDRSGVAHELKIQRLRRLRYMEYTGVDHNTDKAYEHDFGPLSKRAWVWQENALATRIVHYTDHGLVWECRGEEGVFGEEMPGIALPRGWIGSLPWGFARYRNQRQQQWHYDTNTAEAGTEIRVGTDVDVVYKQWHNLVKTYSSRDLTFHADKLPAMGGAAAELSQILNSGYLAGLWRKNLINDLLWHADTWGIEKKGAFTQHPPTPLENGSPSWSWASLNGRVSYHFLDDEELNPSTAEVRALATVRDFHVETTSRHSAFGQCRSGGYIVLRAPAMRAQVSATIPTNYYGYHLFHVESRQRIPECIADTVLETYVHPHHSASGSDESGDVDKGEERRGEGEGGLHNWGGITLRRGGVAAGGENGDFGYVQGEVLCVLLQQRGDTVFTLVLARSESDSEAFVRIGYSRVDIKRLDVGRARVMERVVIK
ncbi:heterokaryon incompatibility protein-domain-containing protein [Nemania sp. FL0916]|nr:heterokaryon incompatibility protein-domain-containing protein [Nemania sp. FL0916]